MTTPEAAYLQRLRHMLDGNDDAPFSHYDRDNQRCHTCGAQLTWQQYRTFATCEGCLTAERAARSKPCAHCGQPVYLHAYRGNGVDVWTHLDASDCAHPGPE